MTEPKPPIRAFRILAFFLLASTLVFLASTVVLAGMRCTAILGSGGSLGLSEFVLAAGSALAFSLLGALIIAFWPGNRIGWLCGAIGITFSFAQSSGAYADCAISGATLPAVPLMAWLAYLAFPTTILMMFSLLPFLFPDGRFFSPAWRRLALITTTVVVASLLGAALVRGPLIHSGTDTTYAVVNPVGLLPATLGPLFEDLMLLAIVGATLAGIVSLAVRLRGSRGDMRQQLKLLVYFLVVAIAVQLAIELYGDMVNAAIFADWIYLLVLALTFWGFPALGRRGGVQIPSIRH